MFDEDFVAFLTHTLHAYATRGIELGKECWKYEDIFGLKKERKVCSSKNPIYDLEAIL